MRKQFTLVGDDWFSDKVNLDKYIFTMSTRENFTVRGSVHKLICYMVAFLHSGCAESS